MTRRRSEDDEYPERGEIVEPVTETETPATTDEPLPYQGSAARLGTGNIPGTDVQWPPGRVENATTAHTQVVTTAEGILAPTEAADSEVDVADIPEECAANPADADGVTGRNPYEPLADSAE